MRQRNLKFLLVTLLVASGLLFAGGEARANFTSFKYNFYSSPSIPTSYYSGIWTYNFSQAGSSSTSIKNILLEIPAEVPYNGNITLKYYSPTNSAPVNLTYTALGTCNGDTDTRLGVGDCRYNVLKINPTSSSGFSTNFKIELVLNIPTAALPPGKKLGSSIQVIQLKSGNSLSDSDVAYVPTLVDIPPSTPTSMNVTISANPPTIGYGAGSDGASIECTNLTWNTTPNAEIVAISGVGLVRGSGPDVNPVVCPKDNTTYKITAILGTLVVDNTTTVTVIPPPPPVIEASVETVEKKDESGAVTGYVTFYSLEGVLQCSCATGPDQSTDPIIPFEQACFAEPPNLKCTPASIADLIPPLVCIRVIEGAETSNCNSAVDSDLCTTFYNPPGSHKLYKCDIWALQTRDTIVEIGKKSCTCGWTTTKDRYGKTVSVWSCSGSTCAACSYKTCP